MATPDAIPPTLRRLGYRRSRLLLVVLGLAVLGLTVAVMLARSVEPVEVVGVALFVPIFLAFVFGGVWGGLAAALGASIIYLILRMPAARAVGVGDYVWLSASRVIAYVVFGVLGGWAAGQLKGTLTRADLVDRLDDATGLGNARAMLDAVELERSRAQRYRTLFSVVWVDVPAAVAAPLGRRAAHGAWRDIGRAVAAAVRTVDRPGHAVAADGTHRVVVVLPETPAGGADVLAPRLRDLVSELLARRGAPASQALAATRCTWPDDAEGLAYLEAWLRAVDAEEHPERAAPGPG